MASPSIDPHHLLNVIAATQQPESRLAAERGLDGYARNVPSYGRLLASLIAAGAAAEGVTGNGGITPISIPPSIITLIGILLKRYVQHHWSESSEVFEAPLVSEEEKAALRPLLLPLLRTPHATVRRQVAMIAAIVAEHDCPDRWPQLIHDITNILAQAKAAQDSPLDTNVLLGSLEVLVSFCEELSEEQLCAIIPQLFPALLDIGQSRINMLQQAHTLTQEAVSSMSAAQVQSVKDGIALCRCALQVYEHSCEALMNMNEVVNDSAKGKKQPKDAVLMQYLQPTLPQWLSLFNSLLCLPNPAAASYPFLIAFPAIWSLRVECVRALICVSERFAEHVIMAAGLDGGRAIEAATTTVLDTMEGLWPLYEKKVLNAASEDGEDDEEEEEVDDDGNIISMSAYLYEAFMYLKHVSSLQQPPMKKSAKKGKGKNASTSSAADPKQAAWQHLQSLFLPPSSPLLNRILASAVRYLQLSSKEVSSSLGHVDDYLSFQSSDGEDTLAVGLVASQTVNVRTAVKELMPGCMLANDEDDDDDDDVDAQELAMMGFSAQARTALNNPNYPLLDRAHILRLLCPMLTAMLQQSAAARAQQPQPDPNWWKAREAATLIIAHSVHDITHVNQQAANPPQSKGKKATTPVQPIPFDLQSFIRDILLPDLSTSSQSSLSPPHPLLRAQALHSTSLFAPVFERAQESNLVLVALEALVGNMTAPSTDTNISANGSLIVRISAVHAFGTLCGVISNKSLLTHNNILVQALHNICHLVHAASTAQKGGEVEESALIEVLSTLMMAMKVDEPTTISAEPSLTPLLLGAWSANAHKPAISDAIVDLFSQLLLISPNVCTSVQTRLLPAVEHILKQNNDQVAITGTVGAALDLMFNVLNAVEKHTRKIQQSNSNQQADAAVGSNSPTTVALPELLHPLLFSSLLPLTLNLMLHTDDHSLVEVGMQILTTFLRIHAPSVANLSMTVTPPSSSSSSSTSAPATMSGLQVVCMLAQRFLDPKLDDKLAHNVGNLIVQMVFTLGNVLGEQNVKEIIKAVVGRLYSSSYPPLTQSLLLVFARLIHSSGAGSILGFLSSLARIPVYDKRLVPVKRHVTDKYASELRTELKATEVDALTYTLQRWMEAQADIHSRYPTKVMLMALAKILQFLMSNENGAAQLRTLPCRGYPIIQQTSSSSRRVTRSQTASSSSSSHEPRYSSIPLPTKIVAIMMTEFRECQEKEEMKRKKEEKRKKRQQAQGEDGDDGDEDEEWDGEDDDDFDESDEDDDDDEEFMAGIINRHRAGGAASASPFAPASAYPDRGESGLLSLSDLLDHHAGDMDELDGELEDELYPEAASDPLNQVEIDSAIEQCVAQADATPDRQTWGNIVAPLNEEDKKMLQIAIDLHRQKATTQQQQ